MKNFITFFLTIFIASNLLAQATGSTHNAVTASNITTLNLELDTEDVVVKETKGTRIIIESHITLETISNVTLLQFLIKSGRYDLEKNVNETTQTLNIFLLHSLYHHLILLPILKRQIHPHYSLRTSQNDD